MARQSKVLARLLVLLAGTIGFVTMHVFVPGGSASPSEANAPKVLLRATKEEMLNRIAKEEEDMTGMDPDQKYQPNTFKLEKDKKAEEDPPFIFLAPLAAWTIILGSVYAYSSSQPPTQNFDLVAANTYQFNKGQKGTKGTATKSASATAASISAMPDPLTMPDPLSI
eukprot:TRINITY_DN43858_c0_g1_i1.p2 TRINITY_DN43858_c0_g1~~TRINITY_DN43858_c0_g1_i1.p2  ORF type:complete len:168 (-),score=40.35 TRINITY_DN43858_c0_g1_i1:155-658(-)